VKRRYTPPWKRAIVKLTADTDQLAARLSATELTCEHLLRQIDRILASPFVESSTRHKLHLEALQAGTPGVPLMPD